MKKDIIILNLCEELSPQIMDYFNRRDIQLIDPKIDEKNYKWTHVLTQNLQDFSFLRESYKTIENNIQIISLTPVTDKQNFICANGKVVLNEFWIKSKIKNFILDKFFQEYLSQDVSLSEVRFGTIGKFNLHKFHIIGDHFDQLVSASHEESVSAVNVRSFLDHTLMYLAALKNRQKMDFPLEVVYGTSEDAFGVQFYFPSQGLMIEDVSSAFGMEGNRHSEESLLSTALNRCDFLDFSLIESAKKMVITAAWVKGGGVDDASLLLTTLPHKAKLVGYLQESNIGPAVSNGADYLEHIHLPENQNEEIRRVSGENFSEIIATRISDVLELERIQRIAGTEESEEELVQILKENAQEENDKIVFSGENEFEDVKQIISSSLSQTSETIQKDFINSEELKKIIIKSIGEEKPEVFKVGSFQEKISNEIQRSIGEFCKEKHLKSGDFSREHIVDFQAYFLNKGLKENSIILSSVAKDLVNDLRQRLKTGLSVEFQENSIETVFEKANHHDFDQKRIRSVFKNNLKEALEATFGFEEKGLIRRDEEDVIAKVLGSTPVEREVIKELVQDETAVQPHEPLFLDHTSEKEKALMIQLEAMKKDNQSLLDKLQATILEVRVLKEAKETIDEIKNQAKELSAGVNEQDIFEASIALKQELKKNLEEENIPSAEKMKITELLEREVQLMTSFNDELKKSKKQQIELSQKESLYISELEKMKRQLKARDFMLTKSKESMQKVFQRKDLEIENLKSKLNKSNTLLAQDENNISSIENKHLKMQNLNLTKQLEVYKVKLSSLSENLKIREKTDNSRDEIRKLQMEKNQITSQLNQIQKESQRWEMKLKSETERSQMLQIEMKRLQEELSAQMEGAKASMTAIQTNLEKSEQEIPVHEIQLSHIKELEAKVIQLESKLAESQKNQKFNNTDEKKIIHLEASLKKLTQDIAEARNASNELKKESNKLRQEKTALQNQIERMKKDAQKNKKAA